MNPNFHDGLLDGEQQFQLLADFVPQLMWLANRDGWIYWYNKRCYDYTGATPDRAVQRYLLKVIENMDLRPPRAAA